MAPVPQPLPPPRAVGRDAPARRARERFHPETADGRGERAADAGMRAEPERRVRDPLPVREALRIESLWVREHRRTAMALAHTDPDEPAGRNGVAVERHVAIGDAIDVLALLEPKRLEHDAMREGGGGARRGRQEVADPFAPCRLVAEGVDDPQAEPAHVLVGDVQDERQVAGDGRIVERPRIAAEDLGQERGAVGRAGMLGEHARHLGDRARRRSVRPGRREVDLPIDGRELLERRRPDGHAEDDAQQGAQHRLADRFAWIDPSVPGAGRRHPVHRVTEMVGDLRLARAHHVARERRLEERTVARVVGRAHVAEEAAWDGIAEGQRRGAQAIGLHPKKLGAPLDADDADGRAMELHRLEHRPMSRGLLEIEAIVEQRWDRCGEGERSRRQALGVSIRRPRAPRAHRKADRHDGGEHRQRGRCERRDQPNHHEPADDEEHEPRRDGWLAPECAAQGRADQHAQERQDGGRRRRHREDEPRVPFVRHPRREHRRRGRPAAITLPMAEAGWRVPGAENAGRGGLLLGSALGRRRPGGAAVRVGQGQVRSVVADRARRVGGAARRSRPREGAAHDERDARYEKARHRRPEARARRLASHEAAVLKAAVVRANTAIVRRRRHAARVGAVRAIPAAPAFAGRGTPVARSIIATCSHSDPDPRRSLGSGSSTAAHTRGVDEHARLGSDPSRAEARQVAGQPEPPEPEEIVGERAGVDAREPDEARAVLRRRTDESQHGVTRGEHAQPSSRLERRRQAGHGIGALEQRDRQREDVHRNPEQALVVPPREEGIPVGRRVHGTQQEVQIEELLQLGQPLPQVLERRENERHERVLVRRRAHRDAVDRHLAHRAPHGGFVERERGRPAQVTMDVHAQEVSPERDRVQVAPMPLEAELAHQTERRAKVAGRHEHIEVVLGTPIEPTVEPLREHEPLEREQVDVARRQRPAELVVRPQELARRHASDRPPARQRRHHLGGQPGLEHRVRHARPHEPEQMMAAEIVGQRARLALERRERVEQALRVA